MKQFKTYLLFASLLALPCVMASCSNDDEGDEMGAPIVYMQSFSNDISSVTLDVDGAGNIVDISYPVIRYKGYITRELEHDISFPVTYDGSLVDLYNELNETEYEPFPSGIIDPVVELTIPADSLASRQAFGIEPLADADGSVIEWGVTEYILPFRLPDSKISSEYTFSTNKNVVWLKAKVSRSNTRDAVTTAPDSSTLVADRTGWSVSTDEPFTTSGSLFDGSTSTYSRYSPPQAAVITIDMGKVYDDIAAFYLNTNSSSYRPTKMKVWTSSDGSDFTYQGDPAGVASATQIVAFKSPLSARYIRFQCTSWASSTYLTFAEFNVYIKN